MFMSIVVQIMRNRVQCQQGKVPQPTMEQLTGKAEAKPTLVLPTEAHRTALTSLQLAAYAVDAMRVLHRLQQHAAATPSFSEALSRACPDWRNPGWLDDPADLLVSAMTHATLSLGSLFKELDERYVEGRPGNDAADATMAPAP